MQFTTILLHWYEENKRSLPWRGERDVYRVWVSEIILQQTRIQQGWDYYLRFIEAFPDVRALAEADEEAVLRVWQGLGYYSRARNMHAAAQSIMTRHGGLFPTTYEEIRALKGIGDYTAAAIASFAYHLPHPAVDGNVLRIVSRVFGIHDNIMQNATKKKITALCEKLLAGVNPADFNQALMDFGSLQCVPKNPDCEKCPLRDECYAFKEQKVDFLPVSIKKLQIKERFLHFLFILDDDGFYIEQRKENDIWKGLYQLPLIETDTNKPLKLKVLFKAKHQLTHQTLYATFYQAPPQTLPDNHHHYIKIPISKRHDYAFPTLMAIFFDEMGI